jgi:transposase
MEIIDYEKLSNIIREIIREELEEIRPLNPEYIKKLREIEKEESINFSSIEELETIIKNA